MESVTLRTIWTRMDFAAREAVVSFDDGREAVHALETDGDTGNVESVTIPTHGRTMEIATVMGDRFEVELASAEANNNSCRPTDRPLGHQGLAHPA